MAPPERRRSFVAAIAARQRPVLALCLALLAALAWWWLWRAGAQMAGEAMSTPSPMPGMEMGMAPPVAPEAGPYVAGAALMWAVMMVAMMLPSAAPMILLHDVFSRKRGLAAAGTPMFAAGYMLVWTLFSLGAAFAQWLLVKAVMIDEMALALGPIHAAALLMLAGLYELSALKRVCLVQCQAPAQFLVRNWRPGPGGAALMGVKHGAWCLGCCWALMLLLFVGGVMNLAWVALLGVVVAFEKLAPSRWPTSRIVGSLLIAGSIVLGIRAFF